MEINFVLIQFIGFIGLLFVVLSFQKDNRSFTLGCHIVAATIFVLHFGLLHAWSGAVINALVAARAYVFNRVDSKDRVNRRGTLYIFVLLFWMGGVATWNGYVSLLPVYATTVECISLWSRNTSRMRWLFLAARPGWLIYNVLVKSYAGIVVETFLIMSLLIAVIRFDRTPGLKTNGLGFSR